ncbi:MAG: S49 family peptidase [Geminicoccaceae bacterium]
MFSFPMPKFLRRRLRAPVVPAIRLSGVIGSAGFGARGLSLATLERAIDAAFAHKRAPAVALLINSPGGSPVQSALIAGRIRALAEEKGLPVLAFVEDVAASGGYWLACAADEIFADPSSIVGSIGVVSAGFGFQEAIAKLGIERRVHTTGEHKALLDPFRAERAEDLVLLRQIHGDILARFVAHVRARRGDRLQGDDSQLFDGRIWTGDAALQHGLIDGLGEARAVIRQRYGKDARLALANPRRGWLRRLRFRGEAAHMLEDALAVVEARAHWQRFGL